MIRFQTISHAYHPELALCNDGPLSLTQEASVERVSRAKLTILGLDQRQELHSLHEPLEASSLRQFDEPSNRAYFLDAAKTAAVNSSTGALTGAGLGAIIAGFPGAVVGGAVGVAVGVISGFFQWWQNCSGRQQDKLFSRLGQLKDSFEREEHHASEDARVFFIDSICQLLADAKKAGGAAHKAVDDWVLYAWREERAYRVQRGLP